MSGIDLDLADVGARREGEVGRIVERGLLEAGLHAVGQVVRGIGGERDLGSAIDLSVPVTLNSPFSITMSPSEASSRWAAIFLALASTLSIALTMAVPPTAIEREP